MPTDTSEKGLESIIVTSLVEEAGYVQDEIAKRGVVGGLRGDVESHEHAIREKAEIMVDHFHPQVIGLRKIGGQARAMVVG